MKNKNQSPESYSALAEYLEAVEEVLIDAGANMDARLQILDDILQQVKALIGDNSPTEASVKKCVEMLDDPNSYAAYSDEFNDIEAEIQVSSTRFRLAGSIIALGVLLSVLLIIAAIIVLYVISYNKIIDTQNVVDQNLAQVDVVLQRRYDLIPNLVAAVKGAAEHESTTFTDVTRLRSQFNDAKTPQERQSIANQLEVALGKVMVTVEAHPDLKVNSNFTLLQSQLEGTENRIAVERQRQNLAIKKYNTMIEAYPGRLVAQITGFEPYDLYFEAIPEAEVAPKVSFD